MPRTIVHIPWEWPAGPKGSAGPVWDVSLDPVPTSTNGNDGQVRQEKVLEHELAARLSPTFASILLNEACRNYWNRRWSSASQRLDWLANHLEALTTPDRYRRRTGLDDSFVLPRPSDPDLQRYRNVHVRVSALQAQLRLGLDYFGEPERFVTLMSPEWFKRTVERMLGFASDIEDAYIRYASAADTAEALASAVAALKASKLRGVEELREEKRELVRQSRLMLAALEPLSRARDAAWQEMIARENDFREAVKAGNGCSFEQLLAVGAACATLYATGGTSVSAWLAIGGGLADANDELVLEDDEEAAESDYDLEEFKDALATTMTLVKTVTEAGKATKDFQNAIDKLGDMLEPKSQGAGTVRLPSDDAKILTSAEALDNQLKPFLARLGEAQELKDAVHRYVDACNARNNQLLVLVAAGQKLRALDSQSAQAQHEADILQNQLQEGYDPRLPEFAAFMENAWRESLAQLVRMHHRMQSSFAYYALDDSPALLLDDFSVQALKTATAQWQDRYAVALINAGQDPQTITALRISLRDVLGADRLQELRRLGQQWLTFSLPPDFPEFSTLAKVRITRLDVTMTTAAGSIPDFVIQLLHHGHALLFDENGKRHVYSHMPVRLAFLQQGGRAAVTSESKSENYLGLSPYGPWTLYLHSPAPADPLQDVVLEVYGLGVARRVNQ